MANNVGDDGTPGDVAGERGELFRLTAQELESQVVKRGIGISNTVCFSPDRRTFYFGDTPRNTIWRYDYDPKSGRIGHEQPFFSGFDRGLPDGSIDRVVDAPVTNITTCEFGGPALDRLYVTTAAMMTVRFERLAGSLFVLNAGVTGAEPLRVTIAES